MFFLALVMLFQFRETNSLVVPTDFAHSKAFEAQFCGFDLAGGKHVPIQYISFTLV